MRWGLQSRWLAWAMAASASLGCRAAGGADVEPLLEGTGGGQLAGASGAFAGAGGADCQEFCDRLDGGPQVSPDAALDANQETTADASRDSAPEVPVPDAGPEGPPDAGHWDDCPPPAPHYFAPLQAGSGELSGCPMRVCTGTDLSTDLSWTYPLGVTNLAPFLGCTRVEGDLAVANHPGIDLAVLSCLEHVTGDVLIWNSPVLLSLDGLDALQVVGGDLEIGVHDALHVHSPNPPSIRALSSLRAVGGTVRLSGMSLPELDGLQALKAVGGDLLLAFLELRSLSGLSGLEAIGGNLELFRPERITGLDGANALRSISGYFFLPATEQLMRLSGFAGLRCVGGELAIDGAQAPTSEALQHIDAMAGLKYVGGDVRLARHSRLQSAAFLSAGPRVLGGLMITGNPSLASLPGLASVTDATTLMVADNPMLSECDALSLAARLQSVVPTTPVTVQDNLPCP